MSNKTLGKPEPHSDVLNGEPKTVLIGYGWVGQFVHKYFKSADYYTPEDGLMRLTPDGYMQHEKNIDDWPPPLAFRRYQLAFVGVPTPMNDDGSCDASIVEKVVEQWSKHVDLFIIRSTVAPGTIDKLTAQYPDNKFVMQPEYVGETLGHPLVEPDRQTFIILGGTREATSLAAEYWSLVLHPGAKIRQISGLEAEYCKYMENCFLATKVIFVNDFARLCRKTGVDFLQVREAWLDDSRIGRSHTFAYKDNPGFSGKCLPKDLNAMAHYARRIAGQPLELIEAILKINADMRKKVKNTVPLLPTTRKINE